MEQEQLSLLQTVQNHLQQVQNSPGTPLQQRLLEEADVFLVPQLAHDEEKQAALTGQIAALLPQLQQHPGPLVTLLQRLVSGLSFSQVLSMQPPVDFVGGLDPAAEPYNALMIALLRKASHAPSETAKLAALPAVAGALVSLWLHTPEMGISDAAAEAVLALLATDKEPSNVSVHGTGDVEMPDAGRPSGQGLLWRRIFGDKGIYGLMCSACARGPNKEKTLAQARLMSFAPKLGKLDWSYLCRSHHPEIESEFGLDPASEGLLDFIAVHMADYKQDVLIHINLMQFFADLIANVRDPSSQKHVSVSLQYLQSKGLHDRTISYWLKPDDPAHDPVDLNFLYGPSANYYAIYASQYPEALLQDHNIRQAEDGLHSTLVHLSKSLGISASQWMQGQSPKHDLHVLASLPRIALLPHSPLGTGRQSSPLLLIPCKNTSEDALNTLATVFGGPQVSAPITISTPGEPTTTLGTPPTLDPVAYSEAAAARVLYALYLAHHETLITDLTAHADTVALPDKAIAAINVLTTLATATWAPLPPDPPETPYDPSTPPSTLAALPTESTVHTILPTPPPTTAPPPPTVDLPATGILALLHPQSRARVFPWLLRPPHTFAHLAGGRGDPESAAYRVAAARWACVRAVHGALARTQGPGADAVRDAVEARVREGMWGVREEVGGRIATLEL